jgi:hypothetical protein
VAFTALLCCERRCSPVCHTKKPRFIVDFEQMFGLSFGFPKRYNPAMVNIRRESFLIRGCERVAGLYFGHLAHAANDSKTPKVQASPEPLRQKDRRF